MSKFEIKSLKTFTGREGHGFDCDLFIEKIKVYHVRDNADGGCFRWDLYPGVEQKRLSQELKRIISKMPQKNWGNFKCDMTEDIFIDDLVQALQAEQLDNKLLKLEENHIIWGVVGGDSYSYMKMNKPLDFYDHKQLQIYFNTIIIPKLKPGQTIWNRNLIRLEYKLTK